MLNRSGSTAGDIEAPCQVTDDTVEGTHDFLRSRAPPPPPGDGNFDLEFVSWVAVEKQIALLFRELLPWLVEREIKVRSDGLEEPAVISAAFVEVPGGDRALAEGHVFIGDDSLGIEDCDLAQAAALRASAEGVVEGEEARGNFRKRILAGRAGTSARQPPGLLADYVDQREVVGQAKRRSEGLGEACADTLLDDESVDHNFDLVPRASGDFDVASQVENFAVDSSP